VEDRPVRASATSIAGRATRNFDPDQSDEIEQHALAEQAVHAIERVEAKAQDEREDHAAGLDQGLALSGGPQEPGALSALVRRIPFLLYLALRSLGYLVAILMGLAVSVRLHFSATP
jgi:hypothetical protein